MTDDPEMQAFKALDPIIAAAEGDVVYAVLREWQEGRREELEAVAQLGELEERHGVGSAEAKECEERQVDSAQKRLFAAYRVLARVVPTTHAGLIAQLTVAAHMENPGPMGFEEPAEFVLVSAMEGVKRLAAA